tara:strand:+ start:80 stop:388 length:309 start_codon:yes stop_codon:yes gene_type:complete
MGRASKHSGFYNTAPHNSGMGHDNKIFVAILHQAVRDAFVSNDGFAKRTARAWLLGNSERFQLVCECAGREALYVRQKVKQKIKEEKNGNINLPPMPWQRVH